MIWFCFFSDCSTIGATINPEPSYLCLRVFLNYFGKPSSWLNLGHLTSKRINSQKTFICQSNWRIRKKAKYGRFKSFMKHEWKMLNHQRSPSGLFWRKKRRSLVIYLCTRKSSEFSWQFPQSLRWRFRIAPSPVLIPSNV